jgi:hypothetical protein
MFNLIDLIRFLLFNATFSNISAISWRPVLVVEEAGDTTQVIIQHRVKILFSVISSPITLERQK